MRGKPLIVVVEDFTKRNIPAYAGKTLGWHWWMRWLPEHPRVCGENPIGLTFTVPVNGTSPRMRGKPVFGLAGAL